MTAFASWWNQYPRKEAKKAAMRAWDKLSDIEQTQAMNAIPIHVKYWRALGTEKHYIPLPASWLNGARFEDEIETPREIPKLPARPGESMEEWQARCRMTG